MKPKFKSFTAPGAALAPPGEKLPTGSRIVYLGTRALLKRGTSKIQVVERPEPKSKPKGPKP